METVRFGKISSVNYEAGTVRVVYHEKDDCVTSEIPLLSFEYMMPEVDDAVLVLHLSNGAEVGVVLGRPWSDENKPPEGSQGLWRKDLDREAGKGMLRYKDGTLTIKMNKVWPTLASFFMVVFSVMVVSAFTVSSFASRTAPSPLR